MVIKKPLGFGSLSFVLLLLGFLMNWQFGNHFVVSHALFESMGLAIYSNGTDGFHYPFLASIPFWLAAVLVSKRFMHEFGAVVSYDIGRLMLALSIIVTLLFLIFPTLITLFSNWFRF